MPKTLAPTVLMYYYQYMQKSAPASKATTQTSLGDRSMLVFLCAFVLLVLAGCAGGGGSVPSSGVPPVKPTPPPHTDFYIYVDPTSVAGVQQYEQIKAARFDGIRTYFYPTRLAALRTAYTWTNYDWVPKALALGLKFQFVLPAPLKSDLDDPTTYTAEITAAMKAWPGQTWELLGEPDQGVNGAVDIQFSFALTPAQYVAFVKAIVPSMRAADPRATILDGAIVPGFCQQSISPNWLTDTKAVWPLVDGIGVHPYPLPWLNITTDKMFSYLQSVTALTGKPTVVTEWGLIQQYAPLRPGDYPVPNGGPLSPMQAAANMTAIVNAVNGKLPSFSFYEWDNNDDPWAATEGFGIVGTPELAAFTAARGSLAAAPIH